MSSASVQGCAAFQEVKLILILAAKNNNNVVCHTSTFMIKETPLLFMLERPTSRELRNNCRRMEVSKSFCEKVKIHSGENEEMTSATKAWGLDDQEHSSHNWSVAHQRCYYSSFSLTILCELGIALNIQKCRRHSTPVFTRQRSYTLWCIAEKSAFTSIYWSFVLYLGRKEQLVR